MASFGPVNFAIDLPDEKSQKKKQQPLNKFSEVTHGIECNRRYNRQVQKVCEFGQHLRYNSICN